MKPIIRVENLSKQYRIGARKAQYGTLRDKLAEAVLSPFSAFREHGDREETIWALRDVTFSVQSGEVLGIVGRNGAGKSTLLKVLSRITEPTSGNVDLYGRVASLLEVGTGFHPELTGRENIFLNGAVLGMRKAEICEKFDEIVAFAELETFLDTAVKHYSSGMYMRLAFSVAAHLQPDILIVDEVLAVGDMAFQRKCMGKMGQVAREGRTVLFVSHNLPAVQRLCSSAIYLDGGRVRSSGNVISVLADYQREASTLTVSTSPAISASSVPDGAARFIKWRVGSPGDAALHSCVSRDLCEFVFTLVCKRSIPKARFGFVLRDSEDQLIALGHSLDVLEKELDVARGVYEVTWTIRLPIKAGIYDLTAAVANTENGMIEEWKADPQLVVLPRLKTHLPEQWHPLLNEPADFSLQVHKGEHSGVVG